MLTENYLVEAIKLIQTVLCGTARNLKKTEESATQQSNNSNQITATVTAVDSISPLIDQLMRIVPFEEINSIQFYLTYTKRRQKTTRKELSSGNFINSKSELHIRHPPLVVILVLAAGSLDSRYLF